MVLERPHGPRRRAGRPPLLEESGQLVQALRAHENVDEGEVAEELLLPALGQATGHHDQPGDIRLLEPGSFAQVPGQTGIGLLPDRTGVVHEQSRVLRGFLPSETQLLEHPRDALGIMVVHLTAEGTQVVRPRPHTVHGSAPFTPPILAAGCSLRRRRAPT